MKWFSFKSNTSKHILSLSCEVHWKFSFCKKFRIRGFWQDEISLPLLLFVLFSIIQSFYANFRLILFRESFYCLKFPITRWHSKHFSVWFNFMTRNWIFNKKSFLTNVFFNVINYNLFCKISVVHHPYWHCMQVHTPCVTDL